MRTILKIIIHRIASKIAQLTDTTIRNPCEKAQKTEEKNQEEDELSTEDLPIHDIHEWTNITQPNPIPQHTYTAQLDNEEEDFLNSILFHSTWDFDEN